MKFRPNFDRCLVSICSALNQCLGSFLWYMLFGTVRAIVSLLQSVICLRDVLLRGTLRDNLRDTHFGRYTFERYLRVTFMRDTWDWLLREICLKRSWDTVEWEELRMWCDVFLRDTWDWLLRDVFEETLRDTWVSAWSFQQTLRESVRDPEGLFWDVCGLCDWSVCDWCIPFYLRYSLCDSNVGVLAWRVSIRFQFEEHVGSFE